MHLTELFNSLKMLRELAANSHCVSQLCRQSLGSFSVSVVRHRAFRCSGGVAGCLEERMGVFSGYFFVGKRSEYLTTD